MRIHHKRMRTMNYFSWLAAFALVCATVPVFAQPNPERPPNQRPNREMLRDRAPFGGAMQGVQGARTAFALERVLTEEQRASLREAMEKQRDKMRQHEEKLRDARRELLQASIAEKFDEDVVRQKALEIGKLDAELTVLRAKAM